MSETLKSKVDEQLTLTSTSSVNPHLSKRTDYISGPSYNPLSSSTSSNSKVFDGAVPLDMSTYPGQCIGRVFCGGGIIGDITQPTNHGTGVLVGRNLVLTASHILPWDITNAVVSFVPAYSNGSAPFGSHYSTNFISLGAPDQRDNGPRGIDVGLIILNETPGDALGYFGFQSSLTGEAYEGNWTSVGYPAEKFDGEQAIAWPVQITQFNNDEEADGLDFELISSGYASAPWVGGPLFHYDGQLGPAVNAVVSGNRDGRTVHAGGPLFGSLIQNHR